MTLSRSASEDSTSSSSDEPSILQVMQALKKAKKAKKKKKKTKRRHRKKKEEEEKEKKEEKKEKEARSRSPSPKRMRKESGSLPGLRRLPLRLTAYTTTSSESRSMSLQGTTLCWLRSIQHRHHKFLNQLDHMDRLFYQEFGADPPAVRLNLFVALTMFLTHLLFTAIRVTEYLFMNAEGMESLGHDFMTDITLLIVPVMTTAAVMPLLYFEISNRLMRFWSKALRKSIKRDLGNRSIKFYYEMFLQLARTQDLMGKAFNPFILFSLGWSVFSLCLTIYFITQSDSHFTPPPKHMAPPPYQWLLIIVFNQAYGGLQVLLALVYISVLSFTGTVTNEKTRYVVRDLLGALPEAHDPAGRFYVTCFIYKINSQYMWGVTVWRAFPLERSTFFTIVSMILTYAFLLLKFKKSTNPAAADLEDLAGNLTEAIAANLTM